MVASRARRATGDAHLAAVAVVAALAALAACKSRRGPPDDPPAPVTSAIADAAIADADLGACRAVAARAPELPRTQRAQALLDACQPCGDWRPLLDWNTPAADGGPSRAAIEQAMLACKAYCEPNAKQRFLGALDAARGLGTRGPWRYLGEVCKAAVSAEPDARFMGAPYFALDRIARAIGDPALLAAIELPLPALTVSGVGVELPGARQVAPEAGPIALTVYAGQLLLGSLPSATLSPTGLRVSGDYPGAPIELKSLAARLPADRPAAVLAPSQLAATRIVEVVAAARGRDLRLAIGVPGPRGWILPGTLPVSLTARPAAAGPRLQLGGSADEAVRAARAAELGAGPVAITVAPEAHVADLAAVLDALAERGVKAVALETPRSTVAPKP